MTAALLLLAPELGVDETVGDGRIVGGELDTGSDIEGKNEAVALKNNIRPPSYFLGGRQVDGLVPSICNGECDRFDVESGRLVPW